MTPPNSTVSCPACGAPASGTFCSSCGAELTARACAVCRAELSPQARFCHRCGHPVSQKARGGTAAQHRAAWITAAVLSLVLVGGIIYQVSSATPQNVPDMANAGAPQAGHETVELGGVIGVKRKR
jgi:predicted amidophosphoribosyltransferase